MRATRIVHVMIVVLAIFGTGCCAARRCRRCCAPHRCTTCCQSSCCHAPDCCGTTTVGELGAPVNPPPADDSDPPPAFDKPPSDDEDSPAADDDVSAADFEAMPSDDEGPAADVEDWPPPRARD